MAEAALQAATAARDAAAERFDGLQGERTRDLTALGPLRRELVEGGERTKYKGTRLPGSPPAPAPPLFLTALLFPLLRLRENK